MVRLVCGCLNIKIHVKSVGNPVDPITLGYQVKTFPDPFNQELREVILNLEGIHVEHVYLITKYIAEQWTVHRCNNCQMITHATRSDPEIERVLVCSDLLSDEQTIERLTISPEYSPLFRVVVKPNTESLPVAIDWVPKEVNETLQMLQMKLNTFLVEEERAVEERIREFQEQERDNYAKLQTKAKNDKNTIINTILVNIYKNISDSLVEAMKESPVGSLDVVAQVDDAMTCVSPLTFGDFRVTESPKDTSPQRCNPVSRSESSRSRRSDRLTEPVPLRKAEPEEEPFVDSDDVFHYDPGFQDDPSQPAFSESDDEPHDTDDSSIEEVTPSRKVVHGTETFSTSVPINVPQWGRQISHNIDFDDDLDAAPKDAESMAASIQALARSIHGDSSNVFGELPTSRTRARVLSSQSSCQH